MRDPNTKLIRLLIAAGLLFATLSYAQEPTPATAIVPPSSTPESIPDELQDPAFDRYLDMTLLRDAWIALDPAALTSAGLQLAEGERILFRSHKAVTAKEVLRVAVSVAGEKRDKETLERLGAAADRLGFDDLATSVTAAQKLAGQSRAVPPSVSIPLDKLSPSLLQDYHVVVDMIEDLRIRGNKEAMDELASTLREDEQWPDEVLQNLLQRLKNARANLSGVLASEALAKLAGSTRATFWLTMKIKNKVPTTYAPEGVWIDVIRYIGSSLSNNGQNVGPYKIGYNATKTIYSVKNIKVLVKQGNGQWGAPAWSSQSLPEGNYNILQNWLGVRTCLAQ